jgi:hypothetical protein
VVLAARRFDLLQALAQEIQAQGGQALPVAADLTCLEDIQALVRAALEHFSQIDILFNNAGFGRLDWLEALDPLDDIQSQVQVDLLGLMWMTQAVLPHMIHRQSGHIINMASVAGLIAPPTYTVYAASKFAVRGFSEALRREVGLYGIQVSVIYPGGVATDFSQHARIHRKTGVTTPSALLLSPEGVARAVLRLAHHPRRALVIPWPLRWAVRLNGLFPGLVDRIVEQRFVRRERFLI